MLFPCDNKGQIWISICSVFQTLFSPFSFQLKENVQLQKPNSDNKGTKDWEHHAMIRYLHAANTSIGAEKITMQKVSPRNPVDMKGDEKFREYTWRPESFWPTKQYCQS